MSSEFVRFLEQEVAAHFENDFDDNYPSTELGECPDNPRVDLVGPTLAPDTTLAEAVASAQSMQEVGFLFERLSDEPSRQLLLKLMCYRLLGFRRVKLPRNNPEYWQGIEHVQGLQTDRDPLPIRYMDTKLPYFDLNPLGADVSVYFSAAGLACSFLDEQYAYVGDEMTCRAEPDDVVIDAGGCWGDTVLYFADRVGIGGKVYCFEFVPNNLEVLRQNLSINPHLTDRIVVVEQPLWRASGLEFFYVDWGPGSRPAPAHLNADGKARTVRIDDLIASEAMERLDFIKMDIEGSELPALEGAEAALRRFRPKLAVSLYHNFSDFCTIPRYLAGLDLNYDFCLEHHTIYNNETVLFAVAK